MTIKFYTINVKFSFFFFQRINRSINEIYSIDNRTTKIAIMEKADEIFQLEIQLFSFYHLIQSPLLLARYCRAFLCTRKKNYPTNWIFEGNSLTFYWFLFLRTLQFISLNSFSHYRRLFVLVCVCARICVNRYFWFSNMVEKRRHQERERNSLNYRNI